MATLGTSTEGWSLAESVSDVIIPRKALGEIRKAIELLEKKSRQFRWSRDAVVDQVSFKTRLIEEVPQL